jgi:serine/threonine protein kinase
MPSVRLRETRIKSDILVEKKKEAEEVIMTNSMQGLSLGASSTELQYSRIQFLQEPAGGAKKVYKDGDENDEERTDLGGASRRQWAQLLDGNGKVRDGRVIVEFKERPLIRDETRITEVKKELRSLVRVLRLASQTGQASQIFQVLYCEGFYETQDHYGIVYQLPASVSYSVCESLGNILLRREYRQLLSTDLENRLHLAKALAHTMYNIHSVQWVHKSFNPDNILLFGIRTSDDAVVFDWANPYVVGFDASRANLAHSDKLSTSLRWENRAYTHPERQREGDVKRFSKTFDIYSLGVVLLEIGLLECFKHSSYRKAPAWTDIPARQVQDKFLLLAGDLKRLVGKTYSEVVVACLRGFSFEDDDSHETYLLAAFRSLVCEKFDYVRY